MLRISAKTALRREAAPVAEDRQYGRELRPAKWVQATPANSHEHGAFRSYVGKHADLTVQTKLV